MIHCLHGAVGSKNDWDLFADSFGEKTTPVNLWDLVEKDAPSLAVTGHRIALHADEGDVILGYSMGGRLALHAILANPQRWRAGIVISAHYGMSEGRENRLKHDQKWAALVESDWPKFIEKWNQQSLLTSSCPGLRQATSRDQSAVAASFRHWSLGTQENLMSQLPKISCPLLWITGANDDKFTSLAQKATTRIPNSQHHVIENAGHRVPWEQPGVVSKIVRNFLSVLS